MAGALTAGILVGYVFVVPGLGTVAIAGLLDVPLGTMLIYGTLIGPPTAVLTTFIYSRVLKFGLWNEAKDEEHFEEMQEEPPAAAEEVREEGPAITTPEGDPSVAEDARKGTPAATEERRVADNSPPLYVSLLPILVRSEEHTSELQSRQYLV